MKIGCGRFITCGVVGLVVVGLVVVRPGVVVPTPVLVFPVVPPLVPVDGGVVPPFACPKTTAGIEKPKATAVVIALTQIFEVIPPPFDCPYYPTKN